MVVHTVKQVMFRSWVEKTEAASHSRPTWGPAGSWNWPQALALRLTLQREGRAGADAGCGGVSWSTASVSGDSASWVRERGGGRGWRPAGSGRSLTDPLQVVLITTPR